MEVERGVPKGKRPQRRLQGEGVRVTEVPPLSGVSPRFHSPHRTVRRQAPPAGKDGSKATFV